MLSLRLAALVTAVLMTSAVFAAAPPPRPLGTAEVQRLIEQMGDRDYRARDQAERRLVAEGFSALPLLRKAMGHKDPEVRRRALRLVPGLEHAALVAPKRISMIVRDQPLQAILQEVGKQTGYQIQYQGMNMVVQMAGGGVARVAKAGKGKAAGTPKEPTYSYTFVHEPFWDVIDRICRDCNLILQQGYGDEVVRLYHGTGTSPHVGRDGAFRYAATNMQMYRNIDLSSSGSPSRSESLTLNVTLFAEPRLPFLNMGEPRIEAAYDSEKNSMIPKTNPNEMYDRMGMGFGRRYYGGGMYKQMSMQTSLQLIRVSEKAATIKLIRGVVPMTLLVEQKPVSLSDDIMKAKGKKMAVGELDFSIEDVQKPGNGQYSVKFTVTNKGNPNDYTWQNTIYQRVELLDDKGQKYQNWGSNWHGGGNNSLTMTLTFNNNNGGGGPVKPGEAKRLVYQHWVTKQHDVQFELRDVPLP